jgi:hypothetical protein
MITNTIFMHIEDISIAESAILIRVTDLDRYAYYLEQNSRYHQVISSFAVSRIVRIPMNLNNLLELANLSLGSLCRIYKRFEQESLSANYTYIDNTIEALTQHNYIINILTKGFI